MINFADWKAHWSTVPPQVDGEPLRSSLDLFASCGGLTAGLHKAGVCKTLLANEFDPYAAEAFAENLPCADINTFLGEPSSEGNF
jgi:hypothetical protein